MLKRLYKRLHISNVYVFAMMFLKAFLMTKSHTNSVNTNVYIYCTMCGRCLILDDIHYLKPIHYSTY